jgi:hypothetical protein
MSQTKAMIIVSALEIWFLASIIIYIEIATFKYSENLGPSMAIFAILSLIMLAITIPALGGGEWKKYVKEFDEWDGVNKNKGTWIVAIITVVIFLNFLTSISLWRQLQGWPI